MKVYLAGPITGLSFAGCTDWRQYAQQKLLPAEGLSPMRGKEYLKELQNISGTGEEYAHFGPLSLPRGVMTRDYFDCSRADVLLVNLLGAKDKSAGTIMEMAWAFKDQTPVVCAIEPKGNPHDHMMVNESIGFRCTSLDEAIHMTRMVLGI